MADPAGIVKPAEGEKKAEVTPVAEKATVVAAAPVEGSKIPSVSDESGGDADDSETLEGVAGKAESEGDDASPKAEKGDDKEVDPLDSVPKEYADPTVPEGFTPDPELSKSYKDMASQLKLTGRQYQELPKFLGQIFSAIDQRVEAARLETVSGWKNQIVADKSVNNPEGRASVARAREAFKGADPDAAKALMETLKATGLDYHPGMMKLFKWMGDQFGEGKVSPIDAKGGRVKDVGETMFPKSGRKAS